MTTTALPNTTASAAENELYQDVVVEHKRAPRHFGRLRAPTHHARGRFRAVLTGQLEPEAAQLGKLVSLAGVRRYPGRIKCALLGWHALMHALAADAGAGAEPGATS